MTGKQKKFADNYMICLNATKAAREAGYSKDSAYTIGYENMRKPEIQKYIEDQLAKDKVASTAIRVRIVNELIEIAFFADEYKKTIFKMKALELLSKIYRLSDQSSSNAVDDDEQKKRRISVMSNRISEYLEKFKKS